MQEDPVRPSEAPSGDELARVEEEVGARGSGHEESRQSEEEEKQRMEDDNGERNPKAVRRPHAPTKAQIERQRGSIDCVGYGGCAFGEICTGNPGLGVAHVADHGHKFTFTDKNCLHLLVSDLVTGKTAS